MKMIKKNACREWVGLVGGWDPWEWLNQPQSPPLWKLKVVVVVIWWVTLGYNVAHIQELAQ